MDLDTFFGLQPRFFDLPTGLRLHARAPAQRRADRPVLLLVHGFPQTHAMWRRVAARLHDRFDLVLPDLPGYGDSSARPDAPDHAQQSKRAMAQDLVALMDALGVARFAVCGHDRGGRVAHRLALDHPERVTALSVIDIAPTLDMYDGRGLKPPHTYMDFARAYYHWFHLIQPAPLPETHIAGDPIAYLHAKLGGWGSGGLAHLEPEALAEYERCFRRPDVVHAMCEDYRAAAGIDLVHDRDSRAQGQRVACDTQVLWGQRGVVERLFDPLALWRAQCSGHVEGLALPAGHFIPEECPEATAEALATFFIHKM